MNIVSEKNLTKNVMKEEVISQWFKPKGFDLSLVTLDNSMFRLTLNVCLGTFDEFKRFIQSTHSDAKIEHDAALAMYVQVKESKETFHHILITENDWTASDYGTICHELHHFVHYALDEKGASYGLGGEEIYAYMQGYFMTVIIRAFVELGKANKKKK